MRQSAVSAAAHGKHLSNSSADVWRRVSALSVITVIPPALPSSRAGMAAVNVMAGCATSRRCARAGEGHRSASEWRSISTPQRYGGVPVSASQYRQDDDDRESGVQHEAELSHRSHDDLVLHVVIDVPAGMCGQPGRYQQRSHKGTNEEGHGG